MSFFIVLFVFERCIDFDNIEDVLLAKVVGWLLTVWIDIRGDLQFVDCCDSNSLGEFGIDDGVLIIFLLQLFDVLN